MRCSNTECVAVNNTWTSRPYATTVRIDGMAIVLSVLGVAFAAVCVWLSVRIVNRRERWAKWTLASVVGLPVLYALSFGPACWISSRLQPSGELVSMVNSPIIPVMWQGPLIVQGVLMHYALFGMPQRGNFTIDGASRIEFY